MKHVMKFAASVALWVAASMSPASGATPAGFSMTDIAPQSRPSEVPLGTGKQPDMPAEQWMTFNGAPAVRNVSVATITPFLPAASKATGAAVVIAPGGGFIGLSMDREGWDIARRLADQGIAAFVLKYRLRKAPENLAEYQKAILTSMHDGTLDISTPPQTLADVQAAIRFVEARASEFGVDPNRVGIVGFSAGAIASVAVATSPGTESLPAFVAAIYGDPRQVKVPPNAPPLFIAMASDDPLFGHLGVGLFDNWVAAGRKAELHVFESGGHGFAGGLPGTTTVEWLDAFYLWLQTNGFLSSTQSGVSSATATH